MCRFIGSKLKEYFPSRTSKSRCWRRLPTIFEVTAGEIAESTTDEENYSESIPRQQRRPSTEAERTRVTEARGYELSARLLGKRRHIKKEDTKQNAMTAEVPPSLSVNELIPVGYKQIQDDWGFFLRTPYADFFPSTLNQSYTDKYFLTKRIEKKRQRVNSEAQAYQLSEIAAWLKFFG